MRCRFAAVLAAAFLAALAVAQAPSKEAPAPEVKMSASKGIGPVQKVEAGALDPALAAQGKKMYDAQCIVCHLYDKKKVGGPMRDIAKQRTPEYIVNKILNPVEMAEKDPDNAPVAKAYRVPMPELKITEEEARAVYEYLRSLPPAEQAAAAVPGQQGLKPVNPRVETPPAPPAPSAPAAPPSPAPQPPAK
jgi:mono/diheme cytochrome c family protein